MSYSFHSSWGRIGGSGDGASIQVLATQLMNVIDPNSESYDPDMRSHASMEYVSQICERLSLVQNEGELSGLRVQELCKTLTNLLVDLGDGGSELMLLSARAMCNLMEALPGSGSILVDTESCLEQLLEKLTNIQYIDVAEQVILTLQKMSRERASSILSAGGLAALLTYLDFFPVGVQRVCLQTAGNLVLRVPNESMSLMLDSIPLILQKLNSPEALEESIHTAIITYLVRVTHSVTHSSTAASSTPAPPSYRSNPFASSSAASSPSSNSQTNWLDRYEKSGIQKAIVKLIRHSIREPSLFSSTATPQLISILVSLCRKSSVITHQLLSSDVDIVSLIQQLFIKQATGNTSETTISNASSKQLPLSTPQLQVSPSIRASQSGGTTSNVQQLNPLLSLAMELMPDLRAAKENESTATGRQLFSPPNPAPLSVASASASSASATPKTAASLFSQPSAISASAPPITHDVQVAATRDSSDVSVTSDTGVSESVTRQLTFLSPVQESDQTSSSPDTALDAAARHQMEIEEALEREARYREDEEEEEEENDESNEDDTPAANVPVRSALTSALKAASSAAAAIGSAAAVFSRRGPHSPFKSSLQAAKTEYFVSHPDILKNYIQCILPLFLQSASASNDNHLRYKCLSGVLRILCVADDATVWDASLFPRAAVSAFLHHMLQMQDPTIVASALQLMELIMKKAAEPFAPQLFREGCIETVQSIAQQGIGKSGVSTPTKSAGAAGFGFGLKGSAKSASSSASSNQAVLTDPTYALIQQRAKDLLDTHFASDLDEASSMSDIPVTDLGQPKRRRFSSCATPSFKRAQALALQLNEFINKHDDTCKQLHESKQATNSSMSDHLGSIERELVNCLASICCSIVGSAAIAVSLSARAHSPTSPHESIDAGDTLTTHELLQSGLVDSLLSLLYCPSEAPKCIVPDETSKLNSTGSLVWQPNWSDDQLWRELALQRRQRCFAHAFFALPQHAVPHAHAATQHESKEEEEKKSDSSLPPSSESVGDQFVSKLIEALESMDPIECVSSGVSASQALQWMSQPFRVRLIYKPYVTKRKVVSEKKEDESHMDESLEDAADVSSASKSRSTVSSPIEVPRRSTRSMTRGSDSNPSSAAASPSPASSSASPATEKKKGFFSNALAAIKRKVSRTSPKLSSSAPTHGGPSSFSLASGTSSPPVPPPVLTMSQSLAALFTPRNVQIDTLANFQSIQQYLSESTSLCDLLAKTERVQAGMPASQEVTTGSNTLVIPTVEEVHSLRSRSHKKKDVKSSSSSAATATAGPSISDSEPDVKILEGIRDAQLDSQPVRVMFRFAKKPFDAPSAYQNYSQLQAALINARAGRTTNTEPKEEEDEEKEQDWVDIGEDESLSLFEAIQRHHPIGFCAKKKLMENSNAALSSTSTSSSSSHVFGSLASGVAATAAARAANRPFSAFEMFRTTFDIEFRLTRDPPNKQAKQTESKESQSSKQGGNNQTNTSDEGTEKETDATSSASSSSVKVSAADQNCSSASKRLCAYLDTACSEKNSPVFSSLLLLLHSVHHLSHHWSSLYAASPDLIEFVANNNLAGNGTTARGSSLPISFKHINTVHLPYSHSFSSSKFTRQLLLQCEDPVIVLGGLMPSFVDQLVLNFPFLFHFSSRELLFRVTAFHPARHLLAIHQHIQSTQPQSLTQLNGRHMAMPERFGDGAASSDEDDDGLGGGGGGGGRHRFGLLNGGGSVETQNRYRSFGHSYQDGNEEAALQPADRVAQLKVRVQRDQVLHAAKQLFIAHPATRKGTIRAEFQHEEAVGIGPTLEFFTLVSQQLQLKSLHLWNKKQLKAEVKSNINTVTLADKEDGGTLSASVPPGAGSTSVAMDLDDECEVGGRSRDSSLDGSDEADMETAAAVGNANTAASTATSSSSTRKHAKTKRKRQSSEPAAASASTAPAANLSPPSVCKRKESKRVKSSPSSDDSYSSNSSALPFAPLKPCPPPAHLHGAVPTRCAEFFEFGVIVCPTCNVLEIPYCEQHQQFLTLREKDGSWSCAGQPASGPITGAAALAAAEKEEKKKKRGSSKKKKEKSSDGLNAAPSSSASAAATVALSPETATRIPCLTSTNSISANCTHCVTLLARKESLHVPQSVVAQLSSGPTPRRQLKLWRLQAEEADYLIKAFPNGALVHGHILLQCSTCLCVNFPGYRPTSYGLSELQEALLCGNKGGQLVNRLNGVMQEKSYRSVTRHVTHACDGCSLASIPLIILHKIVDVVKLCKEHSPRMIKKKRDKLSGNSVTETKASKSDPAASPTNASASASETTMMDDDEEQSAVATSSPSPVVAAAEEHVSDFITSSALFPPPTIQQLTSDAVQKAGLEIACVEWLWLVGRFLGQALVEQRLLDLPFSQTLLKKIIQDDECIRRKYPPSAICRKGTLEIAFPDIRNQQAPTSIVTEAATIPPPSPSVIVPMMLEMLELSPHLAKPLFKILAIVYHRHSPLLFPLPPDLLSIDGASIDSLEFDFTLPASPEIELVPKGSAICVTQSNAHVWLWLIARQMLCEGVLAQMHCIQEGLKQVMLTQRLRAFFPHELEELVSGGGSSGSKLIAWDWSIGKLRSAIKFRQGYQPDSPAIQFLLTIMSEFTPKQQRQFTRFITGSPSLPGGSIAALNPPLTVVKIDVKDNNALIPKEEKDSTPNSAAAAASLLHESQSSASAIAAAVNSNYVLPSVMTCSHYLKLVNYPTIEIMREKILLAITEGNSGFTLS